MFKPEILIKNNKGKTITSLANDDFYNKKKYKVRNISLKNCSEALFPLLL